MVIAVTASTLLLSGCGHRYFASRGTNPVIEDKAAGMSIVSTRADRRTILIESSHRICAEPPPDVAEAVSAQNIAALEAKGGSGQVGSALNTALLQLVQRSQGLEKFRTAAFVYCNMWLNGILEREEYRDAISRESASANSLIAQQIEKGSLPGTLATIQAVQSQLNLPERRPEEADKNPGQGNQGGQPGQSGQPGQPQPDEQEQPSTPAPPVEGND